MSEVVDFPKSIAAPADQPLPESFKDFPQTMGEIRSDVSMSSHDWSPRDMLIEMLRRIDGGEEFSGMVLLFRYPEVDGVVRTGRRMAGVRTSEVLGLMEIEKWRLLHQTQVGE